MKRSSGLCDPCVERFAGKRSFVDQAPWRDRLQQAHHLHRKLADLHFQQSKMAPPAATAMSVMHKRPIPPAMQTPPIRTIAGLVAFCDNRIRSA
jgi:hypothetical protein